MLQGVMYRAPLKGCKVQCVGLKGQGEGSGVKGNKVNEAAGFKAARPTMLPNYQRLATFIDNQ